MKFLGNILWFVLGGFIVSIYYFIVGLLFCITIIGIPFGLQLIKLAGFALWPFGHEIQSDTNDGGCLSIFMNVIWILVGGIEIAMLHLTFGVFLCITIIGIPFGLQHFKMALLALIPFGKKIS
ncbi:MAG: YccF domain-containing protein [Bacteroidales bacterium]|nr:YccF domain-containing protein [Bacteroidales bacterium]MBR1959996.1 YccF domain-containing protein [Bacteroidales bacterium]